MGDAFWQVLVLVVAIGLALEAVVIVALMRQLGGVLLQVRPARIGGVEGGPAVGSPVEVSGVALDKAAILLFLTPDCGVCRPLYPAIPELQRHYPEVELVPVVLGADEASRRAAAVEIGGSARTDLAQLEQAWDIPGTPFAVGLLAGGIVEATGVSNSLDQLESLAEQLAERSETTNGAALDVMAVQQYATNTTIRETVQR